MAHILVAYASKKGSTTEIAQAMGKEIRAAGHLVDVTEMKSVSSLEGYNAVVIGAPFYMGNITDMRKFTGRYRDALAKVPVAAFAVGLAPLGKDPAGIDNAMKKLQKTLEPLAPVAMTIFAGRLDPAKSLVVPEMDNEEGEVPGRRLPGLDSDCGLGPGTARENGSVKRAGHLR